MTVGQVKLLPHQPVLARCATYEPGWLALELLGMLAVGGEGRVVTRRSSLHDCVGRAARGRFARLDTSAPAKGSAPVEKTGENQGTRAACGVWPAQSMVSWP